jgi:opacity protein-like surface antigen
MGANVYQNRGGNQTFTDDNPNSQFFGSNLEVSPKNDVGFFGGIKLGYVFGTGWIRPTVEGDFFYNGFRGGADFTLNEAFTPCPGCPTVLSTRQANATTWINTGAFLANFILRFAPGNQKFQPYLGAGVGGYYAESAGFEVVDPVTGRVPINTGGGANHADLAFDALAGADYFSRPISARLLSINTSIIRAPKSIRTKIALWANSWWARVSDSFSTNAGNLPLG